MSNIYVLVLFLDLNSRLSIFGIILKYFLCHFLCNNVVCFAGKAVFGADFTIFALYSLFDFSVLFLQRVKMSDHSFWKLALRPSEYDVVLTDIDEEELKKVIYFIYLEITYFCNFSSANRKKSKI